MSDSMVLDGNTLVVRVDNIVYIYYRDYGGDNNWGLVKEIDLSLEQEPETLPDSFQPSISW